jgi:hypothetical protein
VLLVELELVEELLDEELLDEELLDEELLDDDPSFPPAPPQPASTKTSIETADNFFIQILQFKTIWLAAFIAIFILYELKTETTEQNTPIRYASLITRVPYRLWTRNLKMGKSKTEIAEFGRSHKTADE